MNQYELYHHGILGMKWGIRKYQNADGTLTVAGKQRYGKRTDSEHEDYRRAHSGRRSSSMSDAELRAILNRLQMDRQYSEILSSSAKNSGFKTAMKIITNINAVSASVFTLYKNYGKIAKIINNLGTKK